MSIIRDTFPGLTPYKLRQYELVYKTVREHPNLGLKEYLLMTNLNQPTWWRIMEVLVSAGLINKGPSTTKSADPIPTPLRQGFNNGGPATALAYYYAKFDSDVKPNGFYNTPAELGSRITAYFADNPESAALVFTALQEILAIVSMATNNYSLFSTPPVGELALPEKEMEPIHNLLDKLKEGF